MLCTWSTPCCDTLVNTLVNRYSTAPMSLVLAESRLLPSCDCEELVVAVTQRQVEEMEAVLALEARVKAAVQLVAHGGHTLYHALCGLHDGDAEAADALVPYAAWALDAFCEHATGRRWVMGAVGHQDVIDDTSLMTYIMHHCTMCTPIAPQVHCQSTACRKMQMRPAVGFTAPSPSLLRRMLRQTHPW